MIRRDRSLQLHPRLCFADLINPKDRAASIPNKHLSVAVKGQARCNAQLTRKFNDLFQRRDSINTAIEPAGHEHLPFLVKRDGGWIGDVARELRDNSVASNSKHRNRNMLAA